tara:strand:+ start:110 stop:1138 length:1029 start_codon:yes stop_codon:yes gene_type:complete
MRVLVTGMIAGMDDESYINQVLQIGQDQGLDISYHNLINALESTGGKKLDRLLGTTNYLFEVLREREYRKIGFELEANNVTNAIIRAPSTIEWKHVNIKLKDHKEIAHFIKPDVVVTLIDAEWFIQERMHDAQKRDEFFQRVKQHNFSIREILSWMDEEVSLSEDWAEHLNVRHYVIPIGQNPDSLFKLVKHEHVPSFYVSYSMTHSDPQARVVVNETIARLNKYGLVIDPQAIEIGSSFDNQRDKEVTFSYTVHRDLHWFVGKVDAVVAIHPYAERPPMSTGMMDELGHARDYHKRRYMIYPPTNLSPFTTDSYIEQGHIFMNVEEFFLCLEAEGFKPLGA